MIILCFLKLTVCYSCCSSERRPEIGAPAPEDGDRPDGQQRGRNDELHGRVPAALVRREPADVPHPGPGSNAAAAPDADAPSPPPATAAPSTSASPAAAAAGGC